MLQYIEFNLKASLSAKKIKDPPILKIISKPTVGVFRGSSNSIFFLITLIGWR